MTTTLDAFLEKPLPRVENIGGVPEDDDCVAIEKPSQGEQLLGDNTKNSNNNTPSDVEQSREDVYYGPSGVILTGRMARAFRFVDRVNSNERSGQEAGRIHFDISKEAETFHSEESIQNAPRIGIDREVGAGKSAVIEEQRPLRKTSRDNQERRE